MSVDADLDIRVIFDEGLQVVQQDMLAERGADTDTDMTNPKFVVFFQTIFSLYNVIQRAFDIVIQDRPLFGQGNAPGIADKECNSYAFFQIADRLADCGLADIKLVCGTADAAGLSNCVKHIIIIQIIDHGIPPTYKYKLYNVLLLYIVIIPSGVVKSIKIFNNKMREIATAIYKIRFRIRRTKHMGMTMTQKILAAHAGLDSVEAGQLIEADLDLVLGNDVTTPVAIHEMDKFNKKEVFDKNKIALVMDHFTPNKDIKSAEHCKCVREFSAENQIKNFFDVGSMGIEHALLPEQGLIVAGETCIGADSHTCTYGALGAFSTGVGSTDMAAGMVTGKAWFKVPSAIKFNIVGEKAPWVSGKDVILHIIGMIGVDGALYKSMEFVGDGIKNLTMDDRFTIANMAIEAGAKNGIFPVDELTEAYMKEHSTKAYKKYEADADAVYDEEYTIDLSTLRPTVAFPHLPENTKTIDEVGDIKIDQVVIGSCTNGRISDMRIAADIIKGRQVAQGVRVIVIPGTQEVYLQCIEEGLMTIFVKAGAVVSTPTCGPCLGGHMGVMAAGEKAVSTTNRNFVGRMGHVDSEVYLASPAVAAASAITGKISSPEELGL